MDRSTVLHPQYCCWIELRLGCRIIGFLVIINSFILLSVYQDWDTYWNTIISVVSGVSVITGTYNYKKDMLLVYLCTEIVHILVMFIAAASHLIISSDIDIGKLGISSLTDSDENKVIKFSKERRILIGLGCAYFVSILIHIYFWMCVNKLYKRYQCYRILQNPNADSYE